MDPTVSEEDELVNDIEDIKRIASLVINSEFEDVVPQLKNRTDQSYYHLLGLTVFRTLIAGSYLDKKKFHVALLTCGKAWDKAASNRKKNTGYIFRTDPNEYSDCK